MDTATVVKEVSINAPVSRVWKAITDKEEMKQWYFNIAEFEAKPGFEFSFEGQDDCRIYVHLCKITDVIPNKKLSYTWQYPDFPGIVTEVTFELFEENGGTRVKLTHSGLGQFPTDNLSFTPGSFKAGWEEIIGKNLVEFAEKA
jgi:uncharacterized protein YndB with AHSA1/START domain